VQEELHAEAQKLAQPEEDVDRELEREASDEDDEVFKYAFPCDNDEGWNIQIKSSY